LPPLIQKLFKKESVSESAGILLFFRIIERVIQVFRGIVFARFLGPSEYGAFNLAFFFIPLVVTLSKFGIPSCYERYIPQYERKKMVSNFLERNYLLTVGIGVIVTVFSLSFSKQISNLIYSSAGYWHIILLCALSIIPYVLYENLLSSFNGLRVFKLSALLRFSQFFIFTLLGVAIVIFCPKAIFAISANLISFIIVTSFFSFILWKYLVSSDSQNLKIQEKNFYRKIFKYSIWFILNPIVYIVFNYVDRLMLNRFLGLHDVGIYSVALNISQILFMFGMITGNVLMPNLSNIWERGEKDKAMFILNLAIKIVTLFTLGCAVVLVIFKNQILSILYGSEYLEGAMVIPMLLMFWIFHVIVWIAGTYPLLIEKTYISLIATIPGLILNIGLNYILIPGYGIRGAAIATTTAYIFILIVLLLLNKRENMEINRKIIFICVIPTILLFHNLTLIFSFLLLLILTIKSNFIITKKEKNFFVQQAKRFIHRE
jgi:O-antigen/teichoic acid export membrane protein